ncbi:GOLGA4 [Mytilus edulis]|uniref:GOLGA4 n=1 Tax=Mytilus edulis TaxID=6550 RepID=A0A8S3U4M6_MYTED|nr:GOLGA4 [Mytilus edulis]
MFKNLKKKLEQGVAQTPLKGALSAVTKNDSSATESPKQETSKQNGKQGSPQTGKGDGQDFGIPQAESTPKKLGDQSASPAVGQLVDVPLQDEGTPNNTTDFASALSNLPGDETPRASRSRASSISSVTSDSSFFNNTTFGTHHYQLPSDVESEIDESASNFDSYSKEDLYMLIKRFERRAYKYKSKFMEVAAAYKDLAQEREKIKTTLTMTQDKAFRRISELKEQIKLDMMAKRDLEENYRLMLEEKDEHIKVFQMQIRLLREGKEIPPELENKVTKSKVQSKEVGKGDNSDIQTDDVKILNEKVKRLEGLLSRCKDTIKTNKEKYTQITTEKEQINKQLHEKNAELEKVKTSAAPDTMIKLQNQMKEARKVIEQLEVDREVAIAEVKKQVHEEMELKDQELREIRQQCALLQEENKTNTDKVDRLEKSSKLISLYSNDVYSHGLI